MRVEILHTAARLVALDGWNPSGVVESIKPHRNERFYAPTSITYAVLRARCVLGASWMDMVYAMRALYRVVGLEPGCVDLRPWERAPGRSAEHIERALLRAAHQAQAA